MGHQPNSLLMKTVLAPIDFSPASRRVMDEAIAVARTMDARLVLLHVVRPMPIVTSEFAESDVAAELNRDRDAAAARRLAQVQSELRDEGVTAHTVHCVGFAGGEILEQIDRLEADYVVLGSHGHGAFYDLMVGSTTSQVLSRAKCPVVIVPATARPARTALEIVGRGREVVDV
jgi:nucleotide-binding universal stress UspA family protein